MTYTKNNIKNTGLFLLLAFSSLLLYLSYSKSEEIKVREAFLKSYRIYPVALPANIYFAGEKVPLQDAEVRERIDRELHINTYWQSSTLMILKRSKRFFQIAEPILKTNGIPDDFKYLAVVESGLMDVVSPAGAAGVWQFLKSTAQSYGLEVSENADERYHLEKATIAACRFFREAYDTLGSWAMAAAAFNRGLQGMKNAANAQKSKDYFNLYLNSETSRYLPRIVAAKLIIEDPHLYGYHLKDYDYYSQKETYNINVDTTIADLPLWAIKYETNYKTLKELNPWLMGYALKVTDKNYSLRLPYLMSQGVEEDRR